VKYAFRFAAMYELRRRTSHLICGLGPSIADTRIAPTFSHMLIIRAVPEST
jgi:hypothetical protein